MSIPSVEGDSFIARRQAAYAALFTPSQLDQLMTVYSDDVVYSDYSWGAIGMDKETHRSFLKTMYAQTTDLTVETRSVNGTPEFVAWEITVKLKARGDDPAHNLKDGDAVEMTGVSLVWWRKCRDGEEGGVEGWKVFRGHDYAKPP